MNEDKVNICFIFLPKTYKAVQNTDDRVFI